MLRVCLRRRRGRFIVPSRFGSVHSKLRARPLPALTVPATDVVCDSVRPFATIKNVMEVSAVAPSVVPKLLWHCADLAHSRYPAEVDAARWIVHQLSRVVIDRTSSFTWTELADSMRALLVLGISDGCPLASSAFQAVYAHTVAALSHPQGVPLSLSSHNDPRAEVGTTVPHAAAVDLITSILNGLARTAGGAPAPRTSSAATTPPPPFADAFINPALTLVAVAVEAAADSDPTASTHDLRTPSSSEDGEDSTAAPASHGTCVWAVCRAVNCVVHVTLPPPPPWQPPPSQRRAAAQSEVRALTEAACSLVLGGGQAEGSSLETLCADVCAQRKVADDTTMSSVSESNVVGMFLTDVVKLANCAVILDLPSAGAVVDAIASFINAKCWIESATCTPREMVHVRPHSVAEDLLRRVFFDSEAAVQLCDPLASVACSSTGLPSTSTSPPSVSALDGLYRVPLRVVYDLVRVTYSHRTSFAEVGVTLSRISHCAVANLLSRALVNSQDPTRGAAVLQKICRFAPVDVAATSPYAHTPSLPSPVPLSPPSSDLSEVWRRAACVAAAEPAVWAVGGLMRGAVRHNLALRAENGASLVVSAAMAAAQRVQGPAAAIIAAICAVGFEMSHRAAPSGWVRTSATHILSSEPGADADVDVRVQWLNVAAVWANALGDIAQFPSPTTKAGMMASSRADTAAAADAADAMGRVAMSLITQFAGGDDVEAERLLSVVLLAATFFESVPVDAGLLWHAALVCAGLHSSDTVVVDCVLRFPQPLQRRVWLGCLAGCRFSSSFRSAPESSSSGPQSSSAQCKSSATQWKVGVTRFVDSVAKNVPPYYAYNLPDWALGPALTKLAEGHNEAATVSGGGADATTFASESEDGGSTWEAPVQVAVEVQCAGDAEGSDGARVVVLPCLAGSSDYDDRAVVVEAPPLELYTAPFRYPHPDRSLIDFAKADLRLRARLVESAGADYVIVYPSEWTGAQDVSALADVVRTRLAGVAPPRSGGVAPTRVFSRGYRSQIAV